MAVPVEPLVELTAFQRQVLQSFSQLEGSVRVKDLPPIEGLTSLQLGKICESLVRRGCLQKSSAPSKTGTRGYPSYSWRISERGRQALNGFDLPPTLVTKTPPLLVNEDQKFIFVLSDEQLTRLFQTRVNGTISELTNLQQQVRDLSRYLESSRVRIRELEEEVSSSRADQQAAEQLAEELSEKLRKLSEVLK